MIKEFKECFYVLVRNQHFKIQNLVCICGSIKKKVLALNSPYTNKSY